MAGSDAPKTGRRGAQPRGNSIQLSPCPSMQVQEGREDKPPKGEEEKCPGLLTSPSASSASLFSPSSPPRVRRGIKTQLLRGMLGGGSGKPKTGGKESTSQSDDTSTFPTYNSAKHVILRTLFPRSDFWALCAPVTNTHNRISLTLSLSPHPRTSPPPSLSPPSPPCPLNKSIENQPNPAAGGKPAPHTRTRTRAPTERARETE